MISQLQERPAAARSALSKRVESRTQRSDKETRRSGNPGASAPVAPLVQGGAKVRAGQASDPDVVGSEKSPGGYHKAVGSNRPVEHVYRAGIGDAIYVLKRNAHREIRGFHQQPDLAIERHNLVAAEVPGAK